MTMASPQTTVPVPFHIEVSFPLPGTARLTVAGEVDLTTAPMLGTRLLLVMDAHHPSVLEVDLADVTFMDCSGIGVLVAAHNTADHLGSHIRLDHPQPMVVRLLELVGLLSLFSTPIVPAEPVASPVSFIARRNRVSRIVRALVGRTAA